MLIIRVVKGNERCASKQVKLLFFTLSVVLLVHFISFPFGGFETAAPCKGNGISAQGIVNGVNDTLGPPTTAFKWYRAL